MIGFRTAAGGGIVRSGYLALGKAYLQSGDRSDALGALLKALELNPSMSEVQELLRSLR